MDDIKQVFKENYLRYASYVILDRAIPHISDGLKPVQRRILWTLFQMDDGKLHKVANVAGQTMALHPHGDAPIVEALVHIANRGYLLDTQGNFGNPLTGDPHAAARYIETRLSGLAKETLFNPALTPFSPSYDGRAQEPITLPAKIPLLLLQGAEGIAVGMATKILPHNFAELLEAEIALLEGKPFALYPDFPSGGIIDASEYDKGRGRVKVRATLHAPDEKRILISEICYGTTTESLIHSIDEAAKKGKVKIDSINDYTAEKIEIEIKLPRGHYADKVIEQLYAFTECELTINTQLLCIHNDLPWEGTVDEVLETSVSLLQAYLKKELELERDQLLQNSFEKSLEALFISHRLYKSLESLTEYEALFTALEKGFQPFHAELARLPTREDLKRLLQLPIRRISLFDLKKNQEELLAIQQRLLVVEKELAHLKKYTIRYLKGVLKKYGPLFPRRTKLKEITPLDKKRLSQRTLRIGYDPETGYVGTKVSGSHSLECSSLEKLLLVFADGSYSVINIPEKQYIHTKKATAIWIGPADKETILSLLYKEIKTGYPYVKRFVVKQFILDKEYRFLDPGQPIEHFTAERGVTLLLTCKGKRGKRISKTTCALDGVAVQGVGAKGIRVADQPLIKWSLEKKEE